MKCIYQELWQKRPQLNLRYYNGKIVRSVSKDSKTSVGEIADDVLKFFIGKNSVTEVLDRENSSQSRCFVSEAKCA